VVWILWDLEFVLETGCIRRICWVSVIRRLRWVMLIHCAVGYAWNSNWIHIPSILLQFVLMVSMIVVILLGFDDPMALLVLGIVSSSLRVCATAVTTCFVSLFLYSVVKINIINQFINDKIVVNAKVNEVNGRQRGGSSLRERTCQQRKVNAEARTIREEHHRSETS